MASIRKRGDRWEVQIRRKHVTPMTKTFSHRKDAEVWSRDMERRLDRGEEPVAPAAFVCVRELLTRYARDVSPAKRGGDIERIRLHAMAAQSIGSVVAQKLTTAALAVWRDERLLTVSPGTIIRELGLLRRAMQTAAHEWSIAVPMDVFACVRKPKAAQGRVRRLTAAGASMLIDECQQSKNPALGAAVVLALETGMRRGELVALQWAQVDLARGFLTVVQAKNGHGRHIPLTPTAAAILRTQQAAGASRPIPVTGSAIHQAFEHARERAIAALQRAGGATYDPEVQRTSACLQGLRFHDLRHEAVSRLFEKGLTMIEAAEVSGHRTLAMLRRYSHADVSRIAEKISRA